MSKLQTATSKPIAILTSDWHLCETAPPCRIGEPNWFDAMARPIREITKVQKALDNIPILFAGDMFDHWKPSPKLINFAIDVMPPFVYAIPGQHDLPHHSLDLMKDSGFWTLCQADKIHFVGTLGARDFTLFGYPWGLKIENPKDCKIEGVPLVAIIHKYLWRDNETRYHDAPDDGHYRNIDVSGFDIAVFGDNHIPFQVQRHGCRMFNCGSIMRRRINDLHQPRVGILYQDMSIKSHNLDTSKDSFEDVGTIIAHQTNASTDMVDFLRHLKKLGKDKLDYKAACLEYLDANEVSQAAKLIILDALEG